MNHKIDSIHIKNFRSCKDLRLNLTNFVPLVGYNNAGKSNILSALEWFLKPKILGASDFYNSEEPVEVAGLISGITDEIFELLDDAHRAKILPFVVGGVIKIKRVQPVDAARSTDIVLYVEHPDKGYQKNPTGISNALKELFPEPIRIAAMDNAADDSAKAKTTTTIGKLLAEFCSAVKDKNSVRIDRHLGAISRRMGADGNKRLPELNEIDTSINKKIDEIFPGISLKLHFETPTFEDIFKAGTVRVYEDGSDISRDFTAYGHGAQRSIQMALVRHLAEIRKEAEAPTTTLLLIDEPELYLHPFAIEQVREALHILSLSGYQVFFSTHSAQMITAERAQHTLLVRKTAEGTKTRARLKDALEIVLPTAIAQAQHLFSLTQSNQVLFSNKVVLTEGKTELRLLPFLYSNVSGRTLGQDQIAMIETGSVDSIAKSLQVLKAMDLPALAIVDLDYAFRGAVSNNFVDDDSPELIALKKILVRLEGEGKCKLNGGLPSKKDAPCSPAEAFELLASQADAVEHINRLHLTLKNHGIWLWRKGAIEAHIGLPGKKEEHWVKFKSDVESDGAEFHCKDYAGVCELLKWIR